MCDNERFFDEINLIKTIKYGLHFFQFKLFFSSEHIVIILYINTLLNHFFCVLFCYILWISGITIFVKGQISKQPTKIAVSSIKKKKKKRKVLGIIIILLGYPTIYN